MHIAKATVKIKGAIEDVLSLHGIDLEVRASGTDLSELYIGPGIRLPKTDAFEAAGQLKGSKLALALGDVSGKLSGCGVDVVISGTVGDLIALTDINLQLTGSGKDLAEVGSIIGEKLPATDEFKVQGRLTGSAKALSLQAAQGSARRGNLKLNLQGGIKDLLTLSGMDLKLIGSGRDLSEVGPIIGEKLPATGEFTFQGQLTGSTKALALWDAQGRVSRGGLKDLSAKVIPFWGLHKKANEINCAVVQFDIENGVANSKAFVFDTQVGILSAEGDSNLGTEQVYFLLNSRPEDFSFVNLSTKVRGTGTIMNPKVRPDTLSLVKRGAKEVLGFLALGPLGLLAPFVHLGAHKKHPCDIPSFGQQDKKNYSSD